MRGWEAEPVDKQSSDKTGICEHGHWLVEVGGVTLRDGKIVGVVPAAGLSYELVDMGGDGKTALLGPIRITKE